MTGSSSAADISETRGSISSAGASSDAPWAYTVLRLTLGTNIMLHGVTRLIAGHAVFLAYMTHFLEKAPLIPTSLLPFFAWAIPLAETTIGFLVIIGLGTRFALIAGAVLILCLTTGTNLAQNWDVAEVQLIYAFIYCYLLTHRERNRYSIDGLLAK